MSGKKAKGKRAKSRDLMRNGKRPTVNKLLQKIAVGSVVHIAIDSSVHSGMPETIFQGKTGKVSGRRGRAYEVELMKGNRKVLLVVNSAHLIVKKEKKSDLEKEAKNEKSKKKKAKKIKKEENKMKFKK
ncbi:MAG: 50S ribosomal protein L21e [Candidatus Diapherotrites archaeon]